MTVNRANVYASLAFDCRDLYPEPSRVYCDSDTVTLIVDTRADVDTWARWRHSTLPAVAGGMYRTVWTPPLGWCGAVRVVVYTLAERVPVWAQPVRDWVPLNPPTAVAS